MFLTANILFVRREGAVEFAWTLILKKVSNKHLLDWSDILEEDMRNMIIQSMTQAARKVSLTEQTSLSCIHHA